MAITQLGALNTTALVVPDLYVQIVPPQNLVINGVPTNTAGIVGTASWGPVNTAVTCGGMTDYARSFGPLVNRKYDMGTAMAIAVQQGASSFRCVRQATSDVAASIVVLTNCITYTGKYTGSLGNTLVVTHSAGSKAGTIKVSVQIGSGSTGFASQNSCVFDNIGFGLTANALWVAIASAVNNGIGRQGPSNFIVASAGVGTTAPLQQLALVSAVAAGGTAYVAGNVLTLTGGTSTTAAQLTVTSVSGGIITAATVTTPGSYSVVPGNPVSVTGGAGTAATFTLTWAYASTPFTLSGGADGTAGITGSNITGVDGAAGARTGVYALRGQGCSIGMVADQDLSTQWVVIDTFGLSEGIYMMQTSPSGSAITNGSTGTIDLKSAAGLDSYSSKLIHGDWVWWYDAVNQVTRLVSPQAFALGRLANLAPHQSSLNKALTGVIGTQYAGLGSSGQTQTYSQADLQNLIVAGVDVITNPGAGGAKIWTLRSGHNASSNTAVSGDNYTRMTNYIAASLNAGMGIYVGQVVNAGLFQRIRSTLLSFFQNMLGQGLLGSTDGSLPYNAICDISNNPVTRTSLGYVQADVQVQYQAINEKFIVNIEGGQTVSVSRSSTNPSTVN